MILEDFFKYLTYFAGGYISGICHLAIILRNRK